MTCAMDGLEQAYGKSLLAMSPLLLLDQLLLLLARMALVALAWLLSAHPDSKPLSFRRVAHVPLHGIWHS